MKSCAICDRRLAFIEDSLCKKCFFEFGSKADWVKALIKIDNHTNYMNRRNREICFTDDNRDIFGVKLVSYISHQNG